MFGHPRILHEPDSDTPDGASIRSPSPCAPLRPLKVITLEIVLLIVGLAIGGAVGFNLGQRGRPSFLQGQAADAVIRFIRAVENSDLPRDGVAVVKHVVTDTYDPDTAAYIHAKLREAPPVES
jgi:hypothetical protein